MQDKALVLEAHYTTHIEGTQLTLEESEQLWQGRHLAEVNPDDVPPVPQLALDVGGIYGTCLD